MHRLVYFSFFASFFITVSAFGHGGGLDSHGGHNDHSTGSYHFHSRQSSNHGSLGLWKSKTSYTSSTASPRRNLASLAAKRNEERLTRKEALKKTKEEEEEVASAASKETPEPEYLFHHTKHVPFKVMRFEEVGTDWKIYLTNGFAVRVHKDEVIRIEPVHNAKDFRTWHDSLDKTIVAKFISFDEPNISLELFDKKRFTFDVHKLSHHDQLVAFYEILHPDKLDEYHRALAKESTSSP